MNDPAYWLWNGKEVEGPFTRASLIEKAAQGMIVPAAKVMDTQGERWHEFEEVLAPIRGAQDKANQSIKERADRLTDQSIHSEKERPLFGFVPPAIGNVIVSVVLGLFALAGVVRGYQSLVTPSPTPHANVVREAGISSVEPGTGVSHQSSDAIRLNHAIQSIKSERQETSIWGYIWAGAILCGIAFAFPKLEAVYVAWCLRMGNKRLQRGDYRQAIRYYDTALRTDGGCALAYYHRGLANFKLGNHALAQIDWDQAHRKNFSFLPYA